MLGKCIVIAGGKGTGKSTILRKLISCVPPEFLLMFDVNNEHQEFNRYVDAQGKKYLPDIEDFILQASLSENIVIACEESTIFFTSHNKSQDMQSILTRARHTRTGIIFVFHSLRSIPDYMITFINHLIILKTMGDTPEKIDKKFNNDLVLKAYERVSNAPWLENNGIRYSPHEVVNLI
jgi:hypothetical protein